MPPRVLSTPRSTLMYSCLAYLSPELQAFDSIVRLHSQLTLRVHPSPCNPSRKTILSIPPELLLLIRFHLLPAVANQLCTRSAAALSHYEASLRALLCADCIAYNEDIFGRNVWDWDHFLFPCSCAEIGNIHNGRRRVVQDLPPRFTDPYHWLESHLYSEYTKLPIANHSVLMLWDVISVVLAEFGCEILHSNTRTLDKRGRRTPSGDVSNLDCKSKHILVAPSTTTRRHEVWESEIEEDRRKVLALKRVQRELGLSLEYEEVLKAEEATGPHWYRGSLSTDTTFAARRRLDRSTLMSQDFAFVLLQYFTKILAACVCFPFTFVTIFVTVLCYYCRPGTLRVM